MWNSSQGTRVGCSLTSFNSAISMIATVSGEFCSSAGRRASFDGLARRRCFETAGGEQSLPAIEAGSSRQPARARTVPLYRVVDGRLETFSRGRDFSMQKSEHDHRRQVEQSLRLVKLFMSLRHARDRDELIELVESYVARKDIRQA